MAAALSQSVLLERLGHTGEGRLRPPLLLSDWVANELGLKRPTMPALTFLDGHSRREPVYPPAR